jgi:hypothetical protein
MAAALCGCSSAEPVATQTAAGPERRRTVIGPLRVEGSKGPCRAEIYADHLQDRWQYRIPETLSCREGVFKVYYHPILDWTSSPDGSISYAWQTNEQDYRALTTHPQSSVFGKIFIQGIRYGVTITPSCDGLDVCFTAANISDRAFHDVVVYPCLSSRTPPFHDDDLKRTFVVTEEGLRPVGQLERGSADPRRTHFRVADQPAMPFVNKPFWGESNPTVIKQGVVLRWRDDEQWTIGTAWERVAEVFYNEDGHHCIHSVALLGDLEPGQSATVRGRIVLIPGTPQEAIQHLPFD